MRFLGDSVAFAAVFAAGVSQAQILINELSFGHSGRLSPADSPGRIPHFTLDGHPNVPEILSNKVILTPMAPGNQRASIWADSPLTRTAWVADVEFRASGPNRGGGNMNIWFARRGKDEVGSNSVYTAGKFDGLALVVDTHGGSGGMIRGFLNDGSTDFSHQASVDKLAFGQCNYGYRNLGRPSQIKLRQTISSFKVEIDGNLCFETDKVSLPPGYYFGITAATPDMPDSFEVFKLAVMSDTTVSGDSNNYANNQGNNNNIQYKTNHQQPNQANAGNSEDAIKNPIADAPADSFQTSKEQFFDLHNRLQHTNHQIIGVYNAVEKNQQLSDRRLDEIKQAIDSLRQELSSLRQIADLNQKVKSLEQEIQSMHHDMRQKISAHGESLEANLRQHHRSLTESMTASIPGHGKLMFFFVATQVVLVTGYVLYKRRRASSPKKYL